MNSAGVVRALEKLGCEFARHGKGSHDIYIRMVDGKRMMSPVPMGKKDMPRGTLGSIAAKLGFTIDDILDA